MKGNFFVPEESTINTDPIVELAQNMSIWPKNSFTELQQDFHDQKDHLEMYFTPHTNLSHNLKPNLKIHCSQYYYNSL